MTTRVVSMCWCAAATLLLLAGGCSAPKAGPVKAKTATPAVQQKAGAAPTASTPGAGEAKKPGTRERRDGKDKGATIFSAEDKDRLDSEIAGLDKARKETMARLQVCEQEQRQGLANHTVEIGKLKQDLAKMEGRQEELKDVRKRVEVLEKHNDGNDQVLRDLEEKWQKINRDPKAATPPPAPKDRKEML